MKKIISLILASLLLLGLVACSNTPAEQTPPAVDTPAVEDTPVTPDEPVVEDEPAVEEDPTMNQPATMPEDDMNQPATMPELPADDGMVDDGMMGMPELDPELEAMMNTILEGVNIETMLMNEQIGAERYYWYFGTETPIEGYSAYGCEPMIGSIPLSIAILKVPEGTDAAAVATELDGTVDTRKWICVEAESKVIKSNGQFVLVALAPADVADGVSANFDAYFAG